MTLITTSPQVENWMDIQADLEALIAWTQESKATKGQPNRRHIRIASLLAGGYNALIKAKSYLTKLLRYSRARRKEQSDSYIKNALVYLNRVFANSVYWNYELNTEEKKLKNWIHQIIDKLLSLLPPQDGVQLVLFDLESDRNTHQPNSKSGKSLHYLQWLRDRLQKVRDGIVKPFTEKAEASSVRFTQLSICLYPKQKFLNYRTI